ncbi:MAG: AURKAIP1/COX24 domain-containing protein [Bacilli bacterium]|nr:AURKAIP1/COX24 domain-containing protein [Bacilli bacterium]
MISVVRKRKTKINKHIYILKT